MFEAISTGVWHEAGRDAMDLPQEPLGKARVGKWEALLESLAIADGDVPRPEPDSRDA